MDILEEQIETLQQFTMEAKHTTLEHESTAQSSDEDVNFTWNSFTAGIKTETLQKLTKIKELKVNFPTDTLQSLLGHRQRNSITGTLGDTPGVDWKVAHRKIQKATKEHYRTLELLKNYRVTQVTGISDQILTICIVAQSDCVFQDLEKVLQSSRMGWGSLFSAVSERNNDWSFCRDYDVAKQNRNHIY